MSRPAGRSSSNEAAADAGLATPVVKTSNAARMGRVRARALIGGLSVVVSARRRDVVDPEQGAGVKRSRKCPRGGSFRPSLLSGFGAAPAARHLGAAEPPPDPSQTE